LSSYYNENDPFAAQWLRNLIREGLIADGIVDDRSITEVDASDLEGFTRCHFFAGLGGWDRALSLADWRGPVWTGSCPCQGESVAGKRQGAADPRHLWPAWFRLIRQRRPAVVFGEQVARAAGTHWLDGVYSDMEGIGYAVGAAILPACSVGAPHRRNRLWFVADAEHAERRSIARGWADDGDGTDTDRQASGRSAACGETFDVANASGDGQRQHSQRHGDALQSRQSAPFRNNAARCGGHGAVGDAEYGSRGVAGELEPAQGDRVREISREGLRQRLAGNSNSNPWRDHGWIVGADGKARRVKPGIRLLVNGTTARVGRLRGYGNAVVPLLAAEFIKAYLEC
jgi:DNA (cytosine-5)-methyltransferase 1